ncbi:Na+/H+ antiporter NhaC family protein [uncultured Duncaniella sp.]|uniref:Na+/H+ antiporter NhaC family protein n=1 Tax=uncultured Duncaniella sp. TaxID=2768039 RepID=UPI002674581C|nr:Na+/H+ antiporter NhaC family protein [uncultured Duncaniella sp.]MCI9172510.1 Na+/H+ antiporter NhaC family protein [Muribaculaceae bacterium]
MLPSDLSSVSASRGLLALSPVAVFLCLYLVVSLVIGDFYKMPLSVALLAASMWSVAIYSRGGSLVQRIETFSRSAGHTNILYMIWIFILAGAFASLAKEIGAIDATVNFTLRFFPSRFIVPGLFVAACFISLSIGTSVGTVVALSPLAVEMASASGASLPFYVAVVLGGAFFGDNLSFISDTTIAATRSQGCNMADKFKANLWIALPAALVTLGIYVFMSIGTPEVAVGDSADPWLILPYLVVLVAAVAGVNVTIVLTLGIVTALVMGLMYGHDIISLFGFMGAGIDSMGELIIVTILAAGMLGVIKAAGGIQYLLRVLTSHVSGVRGAQACVAFLAGLVNLCTANNTVAIITVGSISRDIGERFGIDLRKNASLLDSSSCIVQCLIPYGAQTLLASSLAGIAPAAPFPYLYYPWALAMMVALSIIFQFPRRLNQAVR